jgi:hypothetical protein
MERKTVAVLLHDQADRFDSAGYLLRQIIDLWRARGVGVDVLRGTSTFTPADLAIPHLDLTVTPPEYQCFLSRYPRVVNSRLTDISKSAVSANLVTRGDAYDGPVIVKTNCNYGGVPESRLKAPPARRSLPRRIFDRGLSLLRGTKDTNGRASEPSWRTIDSMKPGTYPIFETLAGVPADVFANPKLIVEKFLPELDADGRHCLRYCYCFGDRQINFLIRSTDRVVKGVNASSCDETDAPAELNDIRRRLGVDYGKLDYVLRDGRVVLFDVNRTPAASLLNRFGLAHRVTERLADGLTALLGCAEPGEQIRETAPSAATPPPPG